MVKIGNGYFSCDECPIIDGFDRRIHNAQENEHRPQIEYCSCDKIADEFWAGGVCEDAFCKSIVPPKDGRRKTGLAYRRVMAVKKRNDLFRIMNSSHSRHAGYMDWEYQNGVVSLVGKYVKFPKNSNRQQYWKRYSNRAVRRGKAVGSGKSGYKRCFDYWWTID